MNGLSDFDAVFGFCSLLWLEEVLKDSKRWQERSNFDEFLNSNVYLKFVDKRFRPSGRNFISFS